MRTKSFRLITWMWHALDGQSRVWAWILALVVFLNCAPFVLAATLVDVRSAPGIQKGFFSRDGAWAILTGRSSTGGRIEVRDAATGSVLHAITNPIGFDSVALTRDKQTIAAATSELVAGKHGSFTVTKRIYLYRVSDSALLRSISTDAEANISSLDFSPDGQFLAVNDVNIFANGIAGGVRVFRTSNWTSVMTVSGGDKLVHWSADRATLWTRSHFDGSSQQVSVPTGTVLGSVPTSDYTNVRDVSSNNRVLLADRAAAPQNVIRILNAANGDVPVTYQFNTNAFTYDISPGGNLFTYCITDNAGNSVLSVARMPVL